MQIVLRITPPRGPARLETIELRAAGDERVTSVLQLAQLMARRGDQASFGLSFARVADEGVMLRVRTAAGTIVESDPVSVPDRIVLAAARTVRDVVVHTLGERG